MCDYSLENVLSRRAAVADRLLTTTFPNTITRGFAAVDDVNVAVCLLPGTELAFEHDVECDPAFGFLPNRKLKQSVARFRHINEEHPTAHHDALEFADGQVVLVTRLCVGQRATVLQLPAGARPAAPAEERERAAIAPDPTLAG